MDIALLFIDHVTLFSFDVTYPNAVCPSVTALTKLVTLIVEQSCLLH